MNPFPHPAARRSSGLGRLTVAALLVLIPGLATAAPKPPKPPPSAGFVPEPFKPLEGEFLVTDTLERVRLPAQPRSLRIEALQSKVILEVGPGAAAFLKSMKADLGRLCPEAAIDDTEIVLTCKPRNRLDARVVSDRGRIFLDLRHLRGLPWHGSATAAILPRLPSEGCPGTTPRDRAECAFAEGLKSRNFTAAEELFKPLLDSPADGSTAALRLGDIALAKDDIVNALRLWQLTGNSGHDARLARARICETDGRCLGHPEETKVFDASGLPEPDRTEMELRGLRAVAFRGDTGLLANRMLTRKRAPGRPALCDGALELCRKLVAATLADPAGAGADIGLDLYAAMDARDKGSETAELALAAARVCQHDGAPAFGGNLLAAVTAQVPPRRLERHLAATLGLFAEGKDLPRARVIAAYARARLPKARLASPEWLKLLNSVEDRPTSTRPGSGPAAPPPKKSSPLDDLLGPNRANIDADLKAARNAVARARGEPVDAADAGTPTPAPREEAKR